MADPTEFSVPLEDLMQYKPEVTDIGTIGSPANDPEIIKQPEPDPHSNDVAPAFNPDTDFQITTDALTLSPIELNKLNPDNTEKIGFSNLDKKPVLDTQNVDDMLRWKTQLLFDNADEKAQFLKQELGPKYLIDIDPIDRTNVIVKKKGTRYWGRIDPSINDSLLQEATENIDGIAQALAMPAGVVASALAAGGIEGLRQAAKKVLSPNSDFSESSVAIATGAGGLAGLVGAAGNAGKKATADAADAVLNQTGKLGILSRVKQAARFFESPQYMAQEWGATGKEFSTYGKESIEANFSYLMQNSPEFAALNSNKATLTGKVEAAGELLKQIGAKIGAFYENPENVVKMVDAFTSVPYQQLKEAGKTGLVKKGAATTMVDRAIMGRAERVRRDLLEKYARVILPEESVYLKAFQDKKLTQMPSIQKMGFKNENDAMEALLKDREITAAEAQMIGDGLGERVTYGKLRGSIKSVDTINKYADDVITHSVQKTIEDSGDVEMAMANKLFHELKPVYKIGERTVSAGKSEPFNFTKFVPGALNGVKRQSLMIATKALNRSEVKTALRALGGKDSFEVASGAPIAKSWFKDAMSLAGKKSLRGASFLEAKNFGKKAFLPRDSSAYFSDPTLVNAITESVQDRDLTDTMVRQIDNGNKEGFANTLSAAANQNPDIFDPSPYKSLVKGPNGESVITDKYEREQHRQWIEKTIVDPVEKYKHLKALNSSNAMIKAPYNVPTLPQQNDIRLGSPKGSSTVSRVASQLRQVETAELDDGTERHDYDY